MYTYTRSAGASGGGPPGVGVHAPRGKKETQEVSVYTHPGGFAPRAGVWRNLVFLFSTRGVYTHPPGAPPEAPAGRVYVYNVRSREG